MNNSILSTFMEIIIVFFFINIHSGESQNLTVDVLWIIRGITINFCVLYFFSLFIFTVITILTL